MRDEGGWTSERREGERWKHQHHGLFADLLTFLAIFLAINTTKPWPKYDKTYTPPLFFGSSDPKSLGRMSSPPLLRRDRRPWGNHLLPKPRHADFRGLFLSGAPPESASESFHRKIRGDLSFTGRKISVKMRIGRVPGFEGRFVGATDGVCRVIFFLLLLLLLFLMLLLRCVSKFSSYKY